MAVRPPILQPGDTIGIVTLGSPLDASVMNARVQTLQSMGFQVLLGEHVYAQNGFLAGTDQERASDLMNMFQNEQVKMILPSRGGVGVAGILPHLDYDTIRRHPKIVTGYSDITSLLNVLYQSADLITFHSLLLDRLPVGDTGIQLRPIFCGGVHAHLPQSHKNPPGVPLVSGFPEM